MRCSFNKQANCMAEKSDLAALVAAVCAGAKYRHLDAGLVEAVAAAELAKGRNFKESVKATRNKLHQVAGAYLPDRPDYATWYNVIAQATTAEERRSVARQVMAHHASTRERLPFLDSFYTTILGDLPPIRSVLDLACGLNPLAAAWMPLAMDVAYYACDIYEDQISFLNRAFQQVDQRGQAFTCNLLVDVPTQAADVALLLKTIPCLEQLDKGIGPRLLAQINAPVAVVSYPARSLGGHGKGMVQNYADHFAKLSAGQPWQVTRFDFPTELVFRLTR
jgi:16S rRNA (guanine(1405)-N(7))-methyltransferase